MTIPTPCQPPAMHRFAGPPEVGQVCHCGAQRIVRIADGKVIIEWRAGEP